tara:strand:- start:1069 stop:2277 length:1209 start_codon:yes stop_codon:yes gene_type:complete
MKINRNSVKTIVTSLLIMIQIYTVSGQELNKVTIDKPGLYVENGKLMKDNQPYYGMGVNYFDAFYRNIKKESDLSYQQGFTELKENNIPFVRFMAGGFYPKDWSLYLNNKEAYFSRLDALVETAENEGIGLIPSLFWTYYTVPDIVQESVNQWGNPKSKTIAFMKRYTEEIVTRYASSPAIWAWEFGNESNNHIDLPGLKNLPDTHVDKGSPATRTAEDKLSAADLVVALTEFSNTVRLYDPSRVIFSGNSLPRPSAYHLKTEQNWTVDTIDEYKSSLESQNPNLINSFTIHVYQKEQSKRFAELPGASITAIIKTSMAHSVAMKKPLFIGEFGVNIATDNKKHTLFREFLTAIETNNVQLSCFWVYDFSHQNKDWNTTYHNSRSYMLKAIASLNKKRKENK